jgi:FixJ family two-component response regulator
MPPTVFLVDDDPSYRQSLRMLLEEEGLQVDDFGSAADFLMAYRAQRPGCLVLDVRMPEMSGIELQMQLTERKIRLPIIFLTGHGDVPMSVEAMKAGAVDFIEKPFDSDMLLNSIREAIARDAQLRANRDERVKFVRRFRGLTRRESEVMKLVVSGKPNKEIASVLSVSPRTVEVHRARVMQKMGADSVPELISMAVKANVHGLWK